MRLIRFLALTTLALHLVTSQSPAAPSQPSPQTKSSPVKSSTKPAPKPAPVLPPLDEGELEAGAKFAIARPITWNGSVLLIAHGLRAETDPLVADLFPDRLAYRTLRDEG